MKTYRKRIVAPAGGKGGPGKSTLIRHQSQFLEHIGVSHIVIDCDDENSTTSRFLSNAKFVDIRNSGETDQIIEIAIRSTEDVLLVDLPARSSHEFRDWFTVVPFEELEAQGVRFTIVGVISAAKDSIESVLRWVDFVGDRVDYLLVLNRRDTDLSIYEQSNARKAWLTAGIPEIVLPKLEERLDAELDRLNLTISKALATPPEGLLGQVMTRARLKRYQALVFAEFEKVRHLLIP